MTPLRRRTSSTYNINDNLHLSVWTKGKGINNNNKCIMMRPPVQTATTSTSIGTTANNQHYEQKSILTLNYKLLAIVYLIDSFVLLYMPNRITPLLPFHYRYRTSLVGGSLGHAIASVVSFVLLLSSDKYYDGSKEDNSDIESNSESQTNNDVTDTPKTAINTTINTTNTNYGILNLGLFLFSILSLPVIPGEAVLYPTFQGSFLLFLWILITKCLGVVVTLSHYSR
jgi:hypothetical protein